MAGPQATAGLVYAGAHPDRVAGLVLVGTPGASTPEMSKPIIASLESEKYQQVMDDYMKKLYYTPQDFAITERITDVSRKRGLLNVQVALAWVLQQPGITAPIVGVTKLEQLDQLVGALPVKLEEQELQALSEAYQPKEVVSELPKPKK